MANAEKGIASSLVGRAPDTQSPYGGGGSRGITQVNDSPYRANETIPGAALDINPTDFGEMDSFSQFEKEGDVLQAEEQTYDDAATDMSGMSETEWVDLGRRCYDTGRTFYRQGYQTQHLNNTRMFKSRHEFGSKYDSDAFRNRSKVFRPLTRMASRSWEADIATSLFLNDDYMHISPRNVSDVDAVKAAAVLKEIVNMRLDKIWYPICIGAAQDTFINGPAIAKVFWWHETATSTREVAVTDEMGNIIGLETVKEEKVVHDEPYIDLILPENFIFDPTAKAHDVIGTGNYFIHRKMMSVDDVTVRMNSGEWNLLSPGEILTCRWAMEDDAVKQSKRGEGKPDPVNNDNADTRYEAVMVNEVFVRRNGIWYTYHMMGTQFLLEEPVELPQRYHHGRLPFAYGTAMIESHNNVPDSKTQLGSELQRAVNEISNQRIDNVKLALNKRYLARRGATIDLAALTRSTPGGVIFTNDPASDLVAQEVSDVTGSSYEEVQRLTMEMNEAQGTFSGQAVANNREMNETVGGMKLLSNAATKVNDFDIRTFVFTFVRPVLELFMLTIQYYENDQTIMAIAADNSAYFPRLKLEDLTDDLMTKQLEMKVDTGIGATDPVQRVNTLMYGVTTVMNLPGMAENMDAKAVSSAIFSTLGQGDGAKFFPNLAKNFQEPPPSEPPMDPLVQAAQEEAAGRVQEAQIRAELELTKQQNQLAAEREIKLLQMALDSELQGKQGQLDMLLAMLDNETRLRIANAQDKTKRQTTALQHGSSLQQTAMQQAASIGAQVTPTQQEVINESKAQ